MSRTKQLILRLTDRCNLACRYCYAQSGCGNKADMTLETARKAIDWFAKPGDALKIQFTGGEPLLCTELMEDIDSYITSAGIKPLYSLQTNGTLLTQAVCRRLKAMRCAVGVSLDGMGAANGQRVYPNGESTVDVVVAGIRNLGAAGICCNLNAVVTVENQNFLYQLPELAAYLGSVRGIGLDMFRPLGRGTDGHQAPDMTMLAKDIRLMLEKCEELEQLGVRIRIKELEKVRRMLREEVRETCYCYAQTGDSAAVDPRGDVYPCSSFVGMQQWYMGNVETGFHFIEKIPGPDGDCECCPDAGICRGGCPAGRAACGGCNEVDCLMHRTIIQYGRKELCQGSYV